MHPNVSELNVILNTYVHLHLLLVCDSKCAIVLSVPLLREDECGHGAQ